MEWSNLVSASSPVQPLFCDGRAGPRSRDDLPSWKNWWYPTEKTCHLRFLWQDLQWLTADAAALWIARPARSVRTSKNVKSTPKLKKTKHPFFGDMFLKTKIDPSFSDHSIPSEFCHSRGHATAGKSTQDCTLDVAYETLHPGLQLANRIGPATISEFAPVS